MRNHAEEKAECLEPERGLCTEARGLFDPEVDGNSCDSEEEDEGYDLQCGESLAIAATNRVGEDGLGIKLLAGGLKILFGCGGFGWNGG